MKTQIQSKLLTQAQKKWQVLSLATILFLLGLMSLSTVEISGAANNSNTNLAQNVTTGSLAIDNAPSELGFNNGTPGQTTTANIASDGIIINDTRGSKAGWTASGYLNTNFYKSTDANVQMPINDSGTLRLYWGANNGSGGTTITNITGTTGDAIGGANNNFPGIDSGNTLTLMTNNDINNGAGAFNMTNLKFNYQISSGASVANYITNLKLTVT